MATDPQTLLAAANCYLCYGKPGLLELALVNQWAQNAQGGSSGNLIPPGATYSNSPNNQYNLSVVIGGVYQWTKGPNDVSINDNLNNNCTSNCNITAETNTLTLMGLQQNNLPVTATVVRIS